MGKLKPLDREVNRFNYRSAWLKKWRETSRSAYVNGDQIELVQP